jgi:hypothetical protein
MCSERRFKVLEIDHVDGCTWHQKSKNTTARWYAYLREYKQGVRLRLLCRSCNARENQYTHGTHAERRVHGVTSMTLVKRYGSPEGA